MLQVNFFNDVRDNKNQEILTGVYRVCEQEWWYSETSLVVKIFYLCTYLITGLLAVTLINDF